MRSSPSTSFALWLWLPLFCFGCGGGAKPAPAAPTPALDTTPVVATPAAAPKATTEVVVTLDDVSEGYSDCTMTGTNEAGEELSFLADYDLCPGTDRDASGLVETKVRLTVEKRMVTPPCDGEEAECPDVEQEEVDWVKKVTPID